MPEFRPRIRRPPLARILPFRPIVDTTLSCAGSESASYVAAVFAPFRDAWLATRARLAMLVAAGSDVAEVSVESYHGNLVLTGAVATEEARERAEAAVRALPESFGVMNRIRVRGEQRLRPGGSDAEVRTAVTARLRHAPELRGHIIAVEAVYDGVVRVVGCVPDAATAAVVFDLVADVPGVRRVINDVALEPDVNDDADAA
jgi:osmotically-inducible protein OsmY